MRDDKTQVSKSSSRFTQFILAVLLSVVAHPAISAEKSYCKWGDCKNGLGEKIYKNGSSVISNFQGGLRSGYTIEFFTDGYVCESRFIRGASNGLRYCQTEPGIRSYSYYERNKPKSGSPRLTANSKGRLTNVGKWYPSRGVSPEEIDLGRLSLDHIVLRRTGGALSDKLPYWFSTPSDNEVFLDEKAVRSFIGDKQSDTFEMAEKKFARSKKSDNCKVGDCTNGISRYVWSDGNFTISNYKEGKRDGYGVYSTKSGSLECERVYRENTVNGLSVCKSKYKGKIRAHFSYLVNGKRDKEGLLLITDGDGKITTYKQVSKNPDQDYQRLAKDYEALRFLSNQVFRNELSKEFRGISLPSKTLFDAHVIMASLNPKRRSTNTLDYEKIASDANGAREHEEWLTEQGSTRSKKFSPPPKKVLSKQEKRDAIARATASYEAKKRAGTLGKIDESDGSDTARGGSPRAGCIFGDCSDGFGSYRWKSGTTNTGYYKNRKQHGYSRLIFSGGTECEGNYRRGKRTGLVVCLGKSVASAHYYIADKKSGAGIEWLPDSGEIKKLGVWVSGKFAREERVEFDRMRGDWSAIKSAVSPAMRASFVSDQFLALNFPPDNQSQWLRERELARASRTQSTPNERPANLGCISGECENGFGEFATRKSTIAGNFRNGKVSGYALITTSTSQCEARLMNGIHAGVEHCVEIDSGIHTFSEKDSKGLQAASITLSAVGELIDYKVYEDGTPVNISVSSSRDQARLARLDLEFLKDQLDEIKKNSAGDFQSHKVARLNDIPLFVAKRKSVTQKNAPVSKEEKLKAQPNLKSTRKVSKSKLQKLADIVVELNAGSRQLNFNYRLDRVRIDAKKFELVYEFTSIKPISDLDTSVITIANQTAYCSSSKLKPFRDEQMPARWSYQDAENEAFETVTTVGQCR